MDFQERFRGRTRLVNKGGLADALDFDSNPIQKVFETPKQYSSTPSGSPLKSITYF